jgi:hypothetical protein
MEADILYTVFKFYDIKSEQVRDIKFDRIKNCVRTDPNEILAFFLRLFWIPSMLQNLTRHNPLWKRLKLD